MSSLKKQRASLLKLRASLAKGTSLEDKDPNSSMTPHKRATGKVHFGLQERLMVAK